LILFSSLILCSILGCENATDVKEEVNNFGIENKVVLANIENGIHSPTGLKAGKGLESILVSCLSCHSSKLITQNRATADGWHSMIKWMYETQNLPQLGDQEEIIINYLAEQYPPIEIGRRASLDVEEWYRLEQ